VYGVTISTRKTDLGTNAVTPPQLRRPKSREAAHVHNIIWYHLINRRVQNAQSHPNRQPHHLPYSKLGMMTGPYFIGCP
jgi:hypothetical protein